MPTPESLKAPFSPGDFYHIVCKSVDGIFLFNDAKDYNVFPERFKKYISDFADTWAYIMMNNHTHHICKIKPLAAVRSFINALPVAEKTKSMLEWSADFTNDLLFDNMMERQMNRFLVSYANYYNNKYTRNGAVFQSPFKRIKISGEGYLQQAIIYVNANAQKHNLVTDFRQYNYSSYHEILAGEKYYTDSNSVIAFFEGKEKFVQLHIDQVAYFYSKGWPSSKIE